MVLEIELSRSAVARLLAILTLPSPRLLKAVSVATLVLDYWI